MSLISDALKKVQKEREEKRTPSSPTQSSPPSPSTSSGRRSRIPGFFLWIPVGLLILASLLYLILPSSRKESIQSPKVSETQPPHSSPAVVASEIQPDPSPSKHPPMENREIYEESTVHSPASDPMNQPISGSTDSIPTKPAASTTRPHTSPSEATSSPTPSRKDEKDLYSRATDHLTAGRPEEAARLFKELLNKEKEASIYLHLYRCYRELHRPVMTRFYIREGVKHFPRHFLLRKTAGILHIRSREYTEARHHIIAALERKKNDYSLYTYLGLCDFHSRQYDAALENFRHSLRLNNQALENHYYIGLIHDNRKEYSKALEFYGYFIRLNRDQRHYRHREWVLQRVQLLRTLRKNQTFSPDRDPVTRNPG